MKSIIRYIFSISALVFFAISCGNNSEENVVQTDINQENSSIYGNKDFVFPKLSNKAADQITQWGI